MRIRGSFFCGFVLPFLTLWMGCSFEEVAPRQLAVVRAKLEQGLPMKIVCFGDSVTGLYYHTGGRRAYTDLLGLALRRSFPEASITAINAGVSGNDTRDALARITEDVLSHKPDLVTVMFGLNDMTKVPLDEFKANLMEIIKRCRASGSEVLLSTPNNVITTPRRPIAKLIQYCEVIRQVSLEQEVALADCYAALEGMQERDSREWRLLLSDEVHPNLEGHKRIAELLAGAVSGGSVSLEDVGPSQPAIPHTLELIFERAPLKILAMTPTDHWLRAPLDRVDPAPPVEIIPWPTEGKSLLDLEADAKARVRDLEPDLVVVSVPRGAKAASEEEFIRSYTWILNWSLSFGTQEWDCIVVHPDVVDPQGGDPDRDELIRRLVRAQDLTLVDREDSDADPGEILLGWLKAQNKHALKSANLSGWRRVE